MKTVACRCPLCGQEAEMWPVLPKRLWPWVAGVFVLLLAAPLMRDVDRGEFTIWPAAMVGVVLTGLIALIDTLRAAAWWVKCRHCEKEWETPKGWHP